MVLRKFGFLIVFLSIFSRLNLAKIMNNNGEGLFYNYRQNIEEGKIEDKLPNLNEESKLKLCTFVMQDKDLQDKFNIFLNKTGINMANDAFKLEEHEIIIEDKTFKQKMFPCYGRHEPVRTSWQEDDNYKKIFVSQNPAYSFIFIYNRNLLADYDIYEIYGYMNVNIIEKLPQVSLNDTDLEAEKSSLSYWSYNTNIFEIEVLYIRNVVNGETEIHNDMCDFARDRKKNLCVSILETNVYNNLYWIPHWYKFTYEPMNCVTKKLHFFYNTKYNERSIDQKLFPCYGKTSPIDNEKGDEIPLLYLSRGFREKSVLVYANFSDSEVSILQFIENINYYDSYVDTR